MTKKTAIRALLLRRIVSHFCMDIERRQAFGGVQPNLDLSPLHIADLITWTVTEYILVAQLYSNLDGGIGQVVHVINGEGTAARHISDLAKQVWAADFFRRRAHVVEDANGVYLDVGLLDHSFYLRVGVAAAIVAAVRD